MKALILCGVVATFGWQIMAADVPYDAASSNYLAMLDLPKEKLAPKLQRCVEAVKASKVSSKAEALQAALRFADDKATYMRDARLELRVEALQRVGRVVPEFAAEGDFMWIVSARMPSGLAQVFYVSASTGTVLTVFPDAPSPTVQRTGASRSGLEMNRTSRAAGSVR